MDDLLPKSVRTEPTSPQLQLGLVVVADHHELDVRVSIDASRVGSDLAALLRECGLPINRGDRLVVDRTGLEIDPHRALVDSGLLHGDRLEIAKKDTAKTVEFSAPAQILLHFVAGELSGHKRAVAETVTLGRARNHAGYRIRDPRASKHHARLRLTAAGPELVDLHSTNGTFVNDVRINRPTILTVGDRIRLGRTEALVDLEGLPERSVDGLHIERNGCVLHFERAPRILGVSIADELDMPTAPTTPARRRFPLVASLLPLIMGAAMAILLSPIYAIFAAMSPAMAVFTFFDDRRSGRKKFRDDTKQFRIDIQELVKSVDSLNDRLASAARSRVPPVRVLRWWARSLAPSIWLRTPQDQDFLVVSPAEENSESLVHVTKNKVGDTELVAEAERSLAEIRSATQVPVSLDLREHPLVGVCGPSTAPVEIARAMVAQLTALVSPKYLQLVVIAPNHLPRWEWAKWLPHVETDEFSAIAGNNAEALHLVEWVESLIEERKEKRSNFGSQQVDLPHVVIVVQGPFDVPAATLSRVMDDAGACGMSVIAIGDHPSDLADQTDVVVKVIDTPKPCRDGDTEARVLCDVSFADTGRETLDAVAQRLPVDEAMMFAADLAPLRDVSAGSASASVPRSVSANDLVTIDSLKPESLGRAWDEWRGELQARVGMKAGGPFALDLRRDGPHALVAGTTGSGKSEFLLSLISSMALASPPDRLNFVLIDYKGGAAFSECVELPHTVGYVTNLDDHLAERALISLKAEVTRREKLLRAAQAKDLMLLEEQSLSDAFASLVLIVDEFALLKAEIPDFVNGLVDIAQRGRSLGVHLMLATQKPSGVVTPQIEANTNIRVVQRVASRSESNEVLGSDVASGISRSTPGRCIVKVGANTEGMTEVQAMYLGGRSLGGSTVPDSIARFEPRLTPSSGGTPRASGVGGETDLQRIVTAVNHTWASHPRTALHRPWLPELPSLTRLDQLPVSSPSPLTIPIGLGDIPEQQRQSLAFLDFEHIGNFALYGAPGSGKTTLLRTLAASSLNSSKLRNVGVDVAFYGLDFANGGLSSLSALPNVLEVVDGSDAGRVSLMIRWLERIVAARHHAMSLAAIGSWSEWRRHDSDAPPAMVVMVDGFGQLWSTLEDFGNHLLINTFLTLLADSRSAGVHFIVTANRRSALPTPVSSAIGETLVQRMVSDEDYGYLNVVGSVPPDMPPGRTLLSGSEFQCAVVSSEANNHEQVAALIRLGEKENSEVDLISRRLLVPRLENQIDASELTSGTNISSISIGRSEFGEDVCLNLETSPWVLIVGPNGSGRSNALELIGHQLRGVITERHAVATRRGSRLSKETFTQVTASDPVGYLNALISRVEKRCQSGWDEPVLLCIDDADDYLEGEASDALTTLVQKSAEAGLVIAASANGFLAGNSYSRWVRMMRNLGNGIVLQPTGRDDLDVFGARYLHMGPASPWPGRGVIVARRQTETVQLAKIGDLSPSSLAPKEQD